MVETREPVLSVDALTDGRFAGSESIVARHIVSILCVPLAIRDRLAGAIYVDHREARHLFNQADLEFLLGFADQAHLTRAFTATIGVPPAAYSRQAQPR